MYLFDCSYLVACVKVITSVFMVENNLNDTTYFIIIKIIKLPVNVFIKKSVST